MMRVCKICNKNIEHKSKNAKYCSRKCSSRQGYINNKKSINERNKKHRQNNKEYYRKYSKEYNELFSFINIIKSYNLSIEDYEDMLNEQSMCCAICQEELNQVRIDHDHKTGRVRGLLCHSCNIALGIFKDNESNLYSAIDYLD